MISTGVYTMFTGAPYLPSSDKSIKAILNVGGVKNGDKVVELGSGDGRIIRTLWNRGVKDVTGYEFSVPVYFMARLKRFFAKSGEILKFGNFWKKDFSHYNVLICYLQDSAMERFKAHIWPFLNPGTIVIANRYKVPGIEPIKEEDRVYVYKK